MMKPIASASFACLVSFILSGVISAADPVQECSQRLKRLGSACIFFARVNEGRMPSSLSELCYTGYVTELKDYTCPGTRTEILLRQEIDAKSDYILSPTTGGSEPKPVVQDRSPANHSGTGINIYFSDGSIRWQPTAGPAKRTTSESPPQAIAASRAPSRESPAKPGALSELKTSVGQNIYLGARFHTLTRDEARSLNLSAESGLVVDEIQSASYARVWNLMVGDVLVSAAGTKLVDGADLSRIIATAEPRKRCPISLIRRRASLQIAALIGNLPNWLTKQGTAAPTVPSNTGEIRDINFGLGFDGSGNLIQPGNRFAPRAEKVACLVDYNGLPPNSEVLVEWQYGKSAIGRSLGVLGGSGRLICYLYALRGKPFSSGRYNVLVMGIGQQISAMFYVSTEKP
jgi:hypothetical protein